MKPWIAVLLAGWIGWTDTTKWYDVSYRDENPEAVQASTQTQKPKLRDVLLGPRAKSWREVKEKNDESHPQAPARTEKEKTHEHDSASLQNAI